MTFLSQSPAIRTIPPGRSDLPMNKKILLNAFDMNCAVHQSTGLWRHPRDRSTEYNTMAYWQALARELERGLFDGIFLADVVGVYDVYGGSADTALRDGVQVPVNDPLLLVPAMAAETQHLGFGVTVNLSFEPPYTFARRMTTLDHLSAGRIGWNIVTGYLDSGARATGQAKQTSHDTRYDIAAEFLELMYKLWEGSWEDDAVRLDRELGVYVDPAKVHRIKHHGEYFQLDAIYPSEPSVQRTPVLYQAGTSPKGIAFAGHNAECVFIAAPDKKQALASVNSIREAAVSAGRSPDDILIFAIMTVLTGDTDAQANEKLDDYRHYASAEGALALISGWSGMDFASAHPETLLKFTKTDAIQHTRDSAHYGRGQITVAEAADRVAIGAGGPVVVGSPISVADTLQSWMDETGVDGFNLTYTVVPESVTEFVDKVVPELQSRGVYKTAYTEGTLREKLFGQGPRLRAPHKGVTFRR